MQRRSFVKGVAASAFALSLPQAFAQTASYDVLILGAGLAGLNAAYRLKQAGYKVLVLEAQEHVGGRINTATDLPNKPELGGMQIGHTYGYMRTLAAELGIKLVGLDGYVRKSDFVVNDQLLNAKQWLTHPNNNLNDKEKALPPSAVYFHYLKQAPRISPAFDWNQPKFAHLDVPMAQLLTQLGASPQALAFINANLNAYNLQTLSAADVLHSLALRGGPGGASARCENGNIQMPLALAAKLSNEVLPAKIVTKIEDGSQVKVTCKDGSQYRAKKCVITLPFSVLKDVTLAGNISRGKREAIDTLNYTRVTQTHFAVKAPFWEDDGYSPALWSNAPFGRIFASKDSQGEVKYLTSWVNGEGAEYLDKMSDSHAIKTVVEALQKARPALKGKIETCALPLMA